MKKQIFNRGYLTYALTDGESKVFGLVENAKISDWSYEAKHYYWSEVFRDGNLCCIIRRGELLVNPSNEKLSELHEQSKINLHD